MKKIFLLISIILLIFTVNVDARILMSITSNVQEWSWSARKVGEYRFENGALTTDSSSAGNTLTTNNVTANTTTYKQGSASGDFSGTSSYGARTNADLSSGFPGKSSTGYQNFLIMGWVRIDTLPAASGATTLFSKYYGSTGQRSFKAGIYNDGTNTNFYVRVSPDGAANTLKIYTTTDSFPNLAVNTWYHFALWHDSTLDKFGAVVFTDGGSSYSASQSHTTGCYLGTSQWAIGISMAYDGGTVEPIDAKIDQVVVYSWPDGSNPTEQQIIDQVNAVRGGTAP